MIFIKKVLINNWKKNTETSDMNSGLIFTKICYNNSVFISSYDNHQNKIESGNVITCKCRR